MAIGNGYPLHHAAGRIDDMDVGPVIPEMGEEERVWRVQRRVVTDEERVGGQGAPGAADGAEATELLHREQQQDVEEDLRGQHAGVGGGGGAPPAPGSGGRRCGRPRRLHRWKMPRNLRASGMETGCERCRISEVGLGGDDE